MDDSDTATTPDRTILPGQQVRFRITAHARWGLGGTIVDRDDASASIDMIARFGRTHSGDDLYALFPPVGSEVDAVVEEVGSWHPAGAGIRPGRIRLRLLLDPLETFEWPCDFCGQPTILGTAGDGLTMAVMTNDGPETFTVVTHRTCLAGSIRPEAAGQQARALQIGLPYDRR